MQENDLNYPENDELDYPDEDDGCPECGSFLNWVECYDCGGEGYFDGEDLMSEDPLWYGPDDTEMCETCEGKGGWFVCSNYKNHEKE